MATMSRRDFWINQAFFQAGWPACVLGAANGLLWPGMLVVGAFAAWQLHPRRIHPADARALAAFIGLGLVLDTLWVQLGVVEYALAWPHQGFTPAWLLLLWVSLALAANHSLGVFRERWGLWVLLATVGSPMSYTAAAAFGAVTWTAPSWVVILCLGPIWALLVGLIFRYLGRHQRRLLPDQRMFEALRG
jgi:hypothetical protein